MDISKIVKPMVDRAYEVNQKYNTELKCIGLFNPKDIIGPDEDKANYLKKIGMLKIKDYYKKSIIVSENVASSLNKFVGTGFRKTILMAIPCLAVNYITHDSYLTWAAVAMTFFGIYSAEELVKCTPHELIEKPTERLKRKAQHLDLLISHLEKN